MLLLSLFLPFFFFLLLLFIVVVDDDDDDDVVVLVLVFGFVVVVYCCYGLFLCLCFFCLLYVFVQNYCLIYNMVCRQSPRYVHTYV